MNRFSLRMLICTAGLITATILVGPWHVARAGAASGAQALDFKDQVVYYPEVRPGYAA